MIDGDADDHTTFDGNFYGSMSEGELSFLAIDAYLASSESGDAKGDLYTITGNAYGTTGLIVHNLNSGVSDGSNVPGIKVIEVQNEAINHCQSSTDNACKEGDAFFIASATPNYENIAGFGTIRDGLYSWILQERDGESEGSSDFYLVSQASPDGQNQASSLTSLTTAWFDTAGYVDDHDYGGQLDQNNGGSGADPVTGSSMHSVLWGRINGTWSKRDTTVVDNSIPIDTSANQNVYGVTAGLEMRPNGGDSNTRVGVYGGYLASNTSFDAYSGKSKASGGLVGGYLAFTNGNGWYVDGEVKADFVNLTYQSPYVTIDTKGRTIGFLANTGYRMQNGANFFEPILSFAYANTQVDDATVGTTTVDYSAGNSIRAGVGARVGTTVGAPGAVQTELDLTAKVWDEFGQPNSVTIDDTVTPNPVTVTDDIAGLFGEVTGRATVYNADRTGSGFLSIGGRFGSNSTTITAKAGLRKNF
jgi:outer membrane autotransporter protein